jgi:hypothetical protein
MRGMAGESIDSCVTDAPYGLSFQGEKWDYQIPGVEIFAEIYRVLKDGSRLLCFGGTRTMHRMWTNIEDAGFTLEDTIMFMYGSGFPKHKSKLKPAYEPICVARKGYSSHLNIDKCRIETSDAMTSRRHIQANRTYPSGYRDVNRTEYTQSPFGRWPANVVLDEESGRLLDLQSGFQKSGIAVQRNGGGQKSYAGYSAGVRPDEGYGDTGGASRFFYCSKASRAEKNAGLEGQELFKLRDDLTNQEQEYVFAELRSCGVIA